MRKEATIKLVFNNANDEELLTQDLNLEVKNNQNLFGAVKVILEDVEAVHEDN